MEIFFNYPEQMKTGMKIKYFNLGLESPAAEHTMYLEP